jgi:hypothetical protein
MPALLVASIVEDEQAQAAAIEGAVVQTRHNTERALAHIHERIARFGDLEPDWDSYGAKPFSPTAMATAKDVLRAVSQRTTATTGDAAFGVRVTPLPSGGILLEWHGPSADLEVEVTRTGRLDLLLEERVGGTDETSEHAGVDVAAIAALLDRALAA